MGKLKKGIHKKCKACKKEFYVPKYRIKTARFCSIDCQNHKQYIRSKHQFFKCRKKFEDSPSRALRKKFCSLDCRAEFQRIYKTTQEKRKAQKILVNNKRGINWSTNNRKHVFALKEKKCEICGYHEYDFCLDIHHKDENPNNNDIKNLLVLCVICHRKYHKGIIEINNHVEN